jgi:gliding motility-associated-like protein
MEQQLTLGIMVFQMECVNTDDVQVTVVANPIPVITGPTQYCSLNPPVLSTVASYASYSWSTGVSTSTATVTEGDNPITVTVTTIQGCSGVSTQHIVQEQPAFQTSGSITICAGQSAMIHGVSQTEAGDYTGNFQTALGCDSVSVITLNVNPLPPVFAGNDIVVCQGNGIVLNATGANSYTWTGGVSNNVQFTPSVGAITYTVTGTSTNGCVNTDQVVVTVNALPIVNAGNDQSVCAGQSAVLTATGANNYVWSNGVTNGGAFMPSQTATYTVTGTDANGCVNSDNLTIVVNPVPTVFAGNNLTVCEGASVTLSGSGATTYSWTGGVTNGVSFVPAAGLNSYTVTGTTSNGCTSTDEVTVFVDLAPDVNFTIDNNLGCVPLTINLTAVGDDLNNCLWSSTSGNWSFNCGSAQMTIIQGGCFDITLSATSSSGCTGSFTANNIVCAEEAPNASFTVVPGSVSWTDPAVAMINSTYGASSYEWYFGDNSPMSTQFQPEHTYPVDVADNYTVMLLAFSPIGCVDTAYSSVEVYEDLIFYVPNTFTPDGDIYNQIFRPVFTSGYDPFDYQLLIFNRWGETIFESNDSNVGWDGTYGLGDMARYVQDGTYVWRIEFKLKRNDSRKIVSGHVNVIR